MRLGETPSAECDVVARVGLISDTHGRVDPRVFPAFEGVDAIAHAGDIGSVSVLVELMGICPRIHAVLGNTDQRMPGWDLDIVAQFTCAGVTVLVIHDFTDLGPIPDDVDVVVSGHTHVPRQEWHGDKLVLNPGSAFRPRSPVGRSVGILEICAGGETAHMRLVPLNEFGEQA